LNLKNIAPRLFRIVLLAATGYLSSCKDDISGFDLEKDPLKGKIGGEEWQYAAGSANVNNSSYYLEGLIVGESTQDPCAIRVSSKLHLSIKIPGRKGSYNINSSLNSEATIIFNLPNGVKRFTATGGFVEVVAVGSQQLIGYMSADFDDDNTVQGSFLLEFCN